MSTSRFRGMALVSTALCGGALLLGSATVTGCVTIDTEKNVRLGEIHFKLGVHELHQNRSHAALKELLVALKHDPENADAHYAMGFLFQGRREYDKAVFHLQEAAKFRADFADAFNNLGTVFLEQGRYDDAIAQFRKALGVMTYATPYLPYGNIGWAFYKRGDLREAVKSLKTALFHNPKFCLGHNNLGVVYAQLGEHALAKRHLEQALVQCPKYVEAQYRLGLSHLKLQRRDLALSQFRTCAELSPESRWGQECGRYTKLLR